MAAELFDGAIFSLTLEHEKNWKTLGDIAEDVMSEAIEAAAALGL